MILTFCRCNLIIFIYINLLLTLLNLYNINSIINFQLISLISINTNNFQFINFKHINFNHYYHNIIIKFFNYKKSIQKSRKKLPI